MGKTCIGWLCKKHTLKTDRLKNIIIYINNLMNGNMKTNEQWIN